MIVAEPLERKLYKLVDERRFLHGDFEGQLRVALERNIINPQEAEVLRSSQVARRSVITVDDFPPNHR